MTIVDILKNAVVESVYGLYGQQFTPADFQVSKTKPEFEGDYTVVLFSLLKPLKKSPEVLGNELGTHVIKHSPAVFWKYNIIKGFLNISIRDEYYLTLLEKHHRDKTYGHKGSNDKKIMVEYSSPNTNKPLHLGHLRNNFLGWSIAEILKANGYSVIKSCIVNDRGIHICKSMLAWQLFANNATPKSTGMKGDHFVGKYYVAFENELRKQAQPILENVMQGNFEGFNQPDQEKIRLFLTKLQQVPGNAEKTRELQDEINDVVRNNTGIMKDVKRMLLKWEQGDPETIELWKMMNGWVYDGFTVTYKRIGSDFDKVYYESETYLLGKNFVHEGLKKGVLYNKPDNSVWIDLTEDGLDEKLVLRSDGTSVYITTDIGLAERKYEEYQPEQSIYVVGDEQNYHLKVLQLICKKLGMPFADGIYHLSYGMVELPSGKMKSREGKVVDADDLVDEMIDTAREHTEELGKVKDFGSEELDNLYQVLGMGAMKFYLLRVDPKKRMIFNPEESIEFHGFTGPFVQYTFARIQSVLKKVSGGEAGTGGPKKLTNTVQSISKEQSLTSLERELLVTLEQCGTAIEQAAEELNPSVIANYVFHLAQTFNSFYTEHPVLKAESPDKRLLRVSIAEMTANVISGTMGLLGITMPDKM